MRSEHSAILRSAHELTPALVLRAAIGGVLMGLANLVPGISGGTMLLAAGVYPAFVASIAELSTLHLRPRNLLVVGVIGGSAAVAILLLAGTMHALVVDQRWVMYSLFIGLTLGGVPLVWRLARPATPGVWLGAAAAFSLMLAMQVGGDGRSASDASTTLLLLSGLAGASAMILPGVSGGYLLLLLGQYEVILGAVDELKLSLLGPAGFDTARFGDALHVVVPVGIGVVIGIVGVSNLLTWLMDRYEKPTLGVLLGLLFGAVVGLWPFRTPVPPQPGDVVLGQTLDAASVAGVDPKYWALARFDPTPQQAGLSLALVAAGLATTLAISRIGSTDAATEAAPPAERGPAG